MIARNLLTWPWLLPFSPAQPIRGSPSSAAQALQLDFIPVAQERYDLAIMQEFLDLPMMQALLAIIRKDKEFRDRSCPWGAMIFRRWETLLLSLKKTKNKAKNYLLIEVAEMDGNSSGARD